MSSEALANWLENPEKPFVTDVRDSAETAKTGILSGARHIPLNQIRARIEEVPRHTPIVVYCRSGHRSYLASRILKQMGRESVYNLDGGLTVWNLLRLTTAVAR